MSAIDEIAAERKRQIEKEEWSFEHDDEHDDGSLAAAAACYAFFGSLDTYGRTINKDAEHRVGFLSVIHAMWPRSWDWCWWNPKSRRRDLVRAGALIVAEIERLDRKSSAKSKAA